ncbi:macro domain-containing protein [Thiomicrospira microaerophila]|uniref:macro domain-containing protein n=1 Tax=Thiomicrospira microaerophila TaxID=406020 RepID=UPI0005CA0E40|nr:macro domain-containing protein [Thiomicrospira microaerophila]
MAITIIKGNIFRSQCQTLVNTINCEGVMGAGIALECRLRYPELYTRYQTLCQEKQISIGKLWIYKSTDRWILNFPTKNLWQLPSKPEYLKSGLFKFAQTYQQRGISSIAFPMLGADKGGLSASESQKIMLDYLDKLDLEIEIYQYDPYAEDDIYTDTKAWFFSQPIEYLSKTFRIRMAFLENLQRAFNNNKYCQLNQLAQVDGVGIKTLEKLFQASKQQPKQQSLIDL